jgi:heat shock protein HslJ
LRNDRRFAAALVAVLALGGCGKANVVGTPEPPPFGGAPALIGPEWRLVALRQVAVLDETRVTAVFGNDGRVAGSAGCNRYFGNVRVTGTRLEVGPLGATRMYCTAGGVMEQEEAFLAALGASRTYRIAGGRLELGPRPDHVTLAFVAE